MILAEKLRDKKIILGSASPRRQQFLKDLGLSYSLQLKPVEEVYPKNLKPEEVAIYLAELKAKAFKENLGLNDLLITGDTIVCLNKKVLGKPKNSAEAKKMLLNLSGKEHQVISSVCLKNSLKTVSFYDSTKVFFKELTPTEIDFYIENFSPLDKAGAYGIQEWIGKIGVEKIEGSYFTVMGMPVHLLYRELLKF
ncbi:Maf family nucleotide pyrophosphatase [Haloflavibacter putidus]|uniref:Maf family nucleotide pyrophosphatase n=1 Tax=Haloflavibacter putidus TaxID=2576776 RepID=UPI0029390F45|nr:Maf family nucleotide pyrophosphatase [Haloflavibacter putidus]